MKPRKRERKIRAWAALDYAGKGLGSAIVIDGSYGVFYIAKNKYMMISDGIQKDSIIPCTITYSLPKKRRAK